MQFVGFSLICELSWATNYWSLALFDCPLLYQRLSHISYVLDIAHYKLHFEDRTLCYVQFVQ